MPNTQFDATIFIDNGVLTVAGPLQAEDDEDAPREVIVCASVTQHQRGTKKRPARNVTVNGEARLFPSSRKGRWQLVRPQTHMNPSPDLAPSASLSYKYGLELSKGEWSFAVDPNGLKEGAAFGSAVLIALEADGTIETYTWSSWVDIAKR